jgi:hypothetical protein
VNTQVWKGNATATGIAVMSSYVPGFGGFITRLIVTGACITGAAAYARVVEKEKSA